MRTSKYVYTQFFFFLTECQCCSSRHINIDRGVHRFFVLSFLFVRRCCCVSLFSFFFFSKMYFPLKYMWLAERVEPGMSVVVFVWYRICEYAAHHVNMVTYVRLFCASSRRTWRGRVKSFSRTRSPEISTLLRV